MMVLAPGTVVPLSGETKSQFPPVEVVKLTV